MEITRRKFTVLTGGAIALQALPGKSFAAEEQADKVRRRPAGRWNSRG